MSTAPDFVLPELGGSPAITLFDTRFPPMSMEMKSGPGSYVPLTRGTDGSRALWSPPAGVSSGPSATFRLTDQIGDSLEVIVPFTGGIFDTKMQFSGCVP